MKKFLTMFFILVALICSLCLFACENEPNEPEHLHTFDQQVAEEKFLNTQATCTAKASYFKSCACGEKGT